MDISKVFRFLIIVKLINWIYGQLNLSLPGNTFHIMHNFQILFIMILSLGLRKIHEIVSSNKKQTNIHIYL